jgi:hypothetical protein
MDTATAFTGIYWHNYALAPMKQIFLAKTKVGIYTRHIFRHINWLIASYN